MITLIAAMSSNRVIGKENTLPRHIPEDLKRFRSLTRNHTVVMGKKTFLSIGKLLPQRENIIFSTQLTDADIGEIPRDTSYIYMRTFSDRTQRYQANTDKHIYIIGGAEIYTLFLPFADTIELTLIDKEITGDTHFPLFENQFTELRRSSHISQQKSPYHFISYQRI